MMNKKQWIIITIEIIFMAVLGIGLLFFQKKLVEKLSAQTPISGESGVEEAPEVLLPYPEFMNTVSGISIESNDGEESVEEPAIVYPDTLLDPEDYENAPVSNGAPYYLKVNRLQNVVTVYAPDQNDRYTIPVRAFVCSVGKNNATPTGTYRTSDKHEWSALVGGVYGQYAYRINGHIMFHSVPYYRRNNGSLESEEYNKLGTAASLGCVRMAVADVKWIYDNCPTGTIVTIYDSDYPGPLGKPVAESLDLNDERSGWDPTDPDRENPWNTGGIRIFGCGQKILERGYSCDYLAGVTAYDENGNDLTSLIRYDTDCNPWEPGEYEIAYRLQTPDGRTARMDSTIRVVDTIAPEIVMEQDYITLNRIQAVNHNWEQVIRDQVQAADMDMPLPDSGLKIRMDMPEEGITQMTAVLTASDEYGNSTERETIIYIDWNPPVIGDPSEYEIPGGTEEEIRRQLLNIIPVADAESGIQELKVTWTQHVSFHTYNVMVIAKDHYGNVTTRFFEGFHIYE